MICPKCGFEQPDGPECMRCGIVVSRYKGPTLGAGSSPVPPPPAFAPGGYQPAAPPPPPPFSVGRSAGPPPPPPPPPVGAVYGDPAPEPAGGTVYQGPLPTPGAMGGTVYGGPSVGPGFQAVANQARQKFGVGTLLTEAFTIYFANIIPFVILTVLALSPSFVFAAWASSLGAEHPLAQFAEPVSTLMTFLLAPIATAGIVYGVFQQMRGGSPSLGTCLSIGFSALLPVLGLAIVQGFLVGCATCFFIIPGLMLTVRWVVAVPAAVEERPGIGEALNRSTYLTEGYRWEIFGVLAVLWVLYVGLIAVLTVAFGGETAVQSGGFMLVTSLLEILTTGIAATAYSVMYYRLRSIKESIDVDQIASVFA